GLITSMAASTVGLQEWLHAPEPAGAIAQEIQPLGILGRVAVGVVDGRAQVELVLQCRWDPFDEAEQGYHVFYRQRLVGEGHPCPRNGFVLELPSQTPDEVRSFRCAGLQHRQGRRLSRAEDAIAIAVPFIDAAAEELIDAVDLIALNLREQMFARVEKPPLGLVVSESQLDDFAVFVFELPDEVGACPGALTVT